MEYTKICDVCGNSFIGIKSDQRYCSDKCRNKAQNNRTHYDSKEKQVVCRCCGKSFTVSTKSTVTYCSDSCRKKVKNNYQKSYYKSEHGKQMRKQYMSDMKECSVYIPTAIYKEIYEYAKANNMSISKLMFDAICVYVADHIEVETNE